MIGELHNVSHLRLSIIAETKVFLRGLKTGASNEQLRTIIRRIHDKEQQLLHEEGAVLDPEMWRILYSRLINRNVEFVDPNN